MTPPRGATGFRGARGPRGPRGARGWRDPWDVWVGTFMIGLAIGLVVLGFSVHSDSLRTHTALCTFVGDLQGRADDQQRKVVRSEKFLHDNPSGIPGISALLLRQGIKADEATLKNQLAAIRSFAGLGC